MAHENATPRPWAVNEVRTQCGRAFRIGAGEMLEAGKGCCIIYDDYPGNPENERSANAALIVEAVNSYDTLRAENGRLRAENAKLSELAETQAEKLSGCPFDRDGYELDLDVPCPVCGGLGHPDSPDACLYPTKSMRAARPALSEAQP